MLEKGRDDDIEFFLKKAFFLTRLACPKRISEFQCLSLNRSIFREDFVILKTDDSFRAKNHYSRYLPKDLKKFPDCMKIQI